MNNDDGYATAKEEEEQSQDLTGMRSMEMAISINGEMAVFLFPMHNLSPFFSQRS